jgi:type II secretory pathway pseudopilin PulG
MIALVVLGLVALAVLALVVGLYDAAQAGERRRVARARRAAWEQRQREERLALARERFPHL